MVFLLAFRAEREGVHGGIGTVVGNAGDDAVARAAVGAGDERVAKTSVGGIEKFPQAVVAQGGIRSHVRAMHAALAAFPDGEAVLAAVVGQGMVFKRNNGCQGG